MTYCIAAFNRTGQARIGINENNIYGKMNMLVYNNTMYGNDGGLLVTHHTLFLENENIYKNNISYNNLNGNAFLGNYVHSNNSWDIPIMITDTDFVSLDYTEMLRPRKKDGSLPDIDFMKLRATSNLIDKGTKDTGLPYAGDAPDLGAWEFGLQPSSGNSYPSVEIISPSNDTTFNAQDNITIYANPSDIDGTIDTVEFFNGETKIGYTTSGPPWSLTLSHVPVGTYSFTAAAIDNEHARTTSAAVIVHVKSDIINLYPNPNNGSFTLVLTDPLQSNGEITISSFEGKVVYKGTMLQGEVTKPFNLQYIKNAYYILVLSGYEIILTRIFKKE
jgi:hypothetical protein